MTPFALIGVGLGLGLGAIYMAAGLGEVAADRAGAERRQQALTTAFQPAVPTETYDLVDPKRVPLAMTLREKPSQARPSDLDCLTAAVYFEARGETARGQAAVAQVVLNRVQHRAFPKTVCAVVYQGAGRRSCQFSFACDGVADVRRENAAWKRAHRVAVQALAGVEDHEVGQATHFHAASVAPNWGAHMSKVAQIGLHVFYRLRPAGAAMVQAAPTETAEADVKLASFTPVEPTALQAQVLLLPSLQPARDAVSAANAEPAPASEAAPIAATPIH